MLTRVCGIIAHLQMLLPHVVCLREHEEALGIPRQWRVLCIQLPHLSSYKPIRELLAAVMSLMTCIFRQA